MLAFDTECTGVDVESDHILSASFVHIGLDQGGQYRVSTHTDWINPGVPIPVGATAIHGITDEFIRLNGGDPGEVLEGVVLYLAAVLDEGTPLVGMNLVYDLTILDRNCRRHGVQPLGDRTAVMPVIDIFVLDKKVDPYRKGSGMRKLGAICPLYRVDPGTAHDSESDALASARIAWRIGKMYRRLGALDPLQLHWLQVEWKFDQDDSFKAWLLRQNKDTTGVDGHWPIRPLPGPREAAVSIERGQIREEALW